MSRVTYKATAWNLWFILLVVFFITGCGSESKAERINIATATSGGVYYSMGNAMAQLFNEKIPRIQVSAQATAGTPQNIILMQKKEAEIAFAQSGVVYDAFNGKEMFKDKPNKNLRSITHLYPNVVHIIVKEDSGITSIKQFEGKKIVPGAIGSATEINSREILNLYNLDYKGAKNVQVDYLGNSEAGDALKNGHVDGIIIASGLPAAAVMDAASSIKIKLLSIEPEIIKNIIAEKPWYYEFLIPKGTYMGQTEDVRTVAVANILICRSDLSETFVYSLTKAIYENTTTLENSHKAASDITLKNSQKGLSIPLHPGAEKYYREKNVPIESNK